MKPTNRVEIEYLGEGRQQWMVSRLNDDGTADTIFYSTISGVLQRTYGFLSDILKEVEENDNQG